MKILHHEEKFEYPLMKLIRERAEQLDISYLAAAKIVIPEYAAPLGWRDDEYSEKMRLAEIDARAAIMEAYKAEQEAAAGKQGGA